MDLISDGDDLPAYSFVAASLLYMVKLGYAEKIRRFMQDGGGLLTTFFRGYVDEHDLVTIGGYPGRLRDIPSIRVEESAQSLCRYARADPQFFWKRSRLLCRDAFQRRLLPHID